MSKKIISVFLIFAISLSMFALPVHAAEGEPTIGSLTGSFWQMLVSSSTDFVQYLFGTVSNIFNADAICPSSPDAKHHPGRVGAGRLSYEVTVWCKYCNEPCSLDDSVLEDAYQDYVETLPPGLNSGSTGTTKWGAGVQLDDNTNVLSNELWRSLDLFSLCQTASLDEFLLVSSDGKNKFWGFQVVADSASGLPCLFPIYVTSLSPYTTQTLPFFQFVSGLAFYNGTLSAPIFFSFNVAQQYFASTSKPCYYLTSDTYLKFSSTSDYDLGPTFCNLGFISKQGLDSIIELSPSVSFYYCSRPNTSAYTYGFLPLVEESNDSDYSGSRPGSVTGNFGTMGDNGAVNNIGNQVIVNEGNGTFYNPATGKMESMESWQYDYATRTYNIVTGDGQTVTVTYGNENLTINNGDVTYNIYYMYEPTDTSNGGGSSGNGSGSGDSSGGGIFDKLGELLGTLGGGLVDAIGKAVEFLLDSLLRLARVVVDKGIQLIDLVLSFFERIPDMFGAFPQFLAAVFPFIPEEVMIILEFGLAAVVLLGIVKILRK